LVGDESYYQNSRNGTSTHWRCSKYSTYGCKARVITKEVDGVRKLEMAPQEHTHVDKKNTYKKKRK
jgi:FLYWCH zinc finger domain